MTILFRITFFSLAILLHNHALADIQTHTQTHTSTPMELESVSQNLGTKYASVCFLGVGDCNPTGDGYDVDTSNQCKNEGFVTTCPAGQKLHKDNRCPYNSSFGKCCTETCPQNSSTSCSGNVVGNDSCGYDCKSCDPCPGYYECGGTWQYCTGISCSADPTRCNQYCSGDYFPNECQNKADCKGVYRNGYCSGSCTPACVETCSGDSSPKSGESWSSSSCTTCNGATLYNNTATACPSGYSTTVDSCDTSEGYRLTTSGKSGNSVCGKCSNSSCPDGYDTSIKSCSASEGFQLETNGLSGGQVCGKCIAKPCSVGFSTDITSCNAGYSLESNGKSGGQKCNQCKCSLTNETCGDATEATISCARDGKTYYQCDSCHRIGGSAEGLVYCNSDDPIYGFTPAPVISKVCGNKNYRTSCGCDEARFINRPGTIGDGYISEICGNRGYRGNYVDNQSWFYRGYLSNACRENGITVSFNTCMAYKCADSGYKVKEAPTSTCGLNKTVCCCPEGYSETPNSSVCTEVVGIRYTP